MPALTAAALAERVDSLPALPTTAVRLIQVMGDPLCGAREMVQIISSEPSLAARVRRVVNSAYFGLRGTVSELSRAVVMLGHTRIRDLALAACMTPLVTIGAEGYEVPPEAFMYHSIATGCAAQMIADRTGRETEAAFVVGLLHDIGKLVLHTYVAKSWDEILQAVFRTGASFDEAERQVLGFDHAAAGAEVARKWSFPDALVDGMRWHHKPQIHSELFLPSAVHIGDVSAMMKGYHLGRDGLRYAFDLRAMPTCGIKGKEFERILADLPDKVDAMVSCLASNE